MRDNMIIRLATSFLVIFILIVTSSHPTHAWVIERVSLGNSGQETAKYDGSGDIGITSLSYDGRFVCFPSEGTALVDGDTNDKRDIFVRDRTRGTTVRVNVSTEGDQILDYSSYDAVISGDGRFVVFDSQTSNLVTGTTPKKMNIYRHEMATGETVLLTKGHDGSAADDSSAWNSYMDASYDGRFVVFPSFATNLVVGDTNAKTDIFVHDCQTGTTSMVSRSADGGLPDNSSNDPAISGDGRYVVFSSTATNLVADLSISSEQVYRYDREAGTTVLVSVASDGTGANKTCEYPDISHDGRYVVFQSAATNLTGEVSADNTLTHIYLRDVVSGVTLLISKNGDGVLGDNNSGGYNAAPKISPDGRFVIFASQAQNLITDGTPINDYRNAFVYDREEKTLDVLNRTPSGEIPNGFSYAWASSEEGKVIAFVSGASNLVTGDTNSAEDVFVALRTGDGWSINSTSQIGGWRNDAAVSGSIAAVAEGKGVTLYSISGSTLQRLSCVSLPIEPTAIAIDGTKLYAASGPWEEHPIFVVADISDTSAPAILGTCEDGCPYDGVMVAKGNYVYHSASEEGGDKTAIGVVDVSNPASPVVLDFLNLGEGVVAQAFDIKDSFLYVQGVQNAPIFLVYDLSNPLVPAQTGALAVGSGETSEALHAEGNYVYSAVGSNGVRIVDVSTPSSPSPRNLFTIEGTAQDVYAEGNILYVAGGNGGLIAFNVTDPVSPVNLGSVAPGDQPFRVDGSSGGVVALFQEGDFAIRTIGFSGGAPVALGEAASPMMTNDVLASGNYLYTGAEGLLIYDMQDPGTPQVLSADSAWTHFVPLAATATQLVGFSSAADSWQKTIFSIIGITDPAHPTSVGSYTSPGAYNTGVVSGTKAFLLFSAAGAGADIIDFSNPASPTKAGTIPFESNSQHDIAASGSIVCLAGQTSEGNRVHIFDVSSPQTPELKSSLTPPGSSIRLAMAGTILFVSSNVNTVNYLEAFDLTDPAVPQRAGAIQDEKAAYDLQILNEEDQDVIILQAKPGGSVHTYGYTPSSGLLYPGPVCPSPFSQTVTVSPTPNSTGSYTVVTSDASYGTYGQEVTRTPTTCCLTTGVSPAEAAADGCKAEPTRVDPVECGGSVEVTAIPADPWVFKEWTGAASGTNPVTDATVTGKCSEAIAVFWKPTLTLGTGPLNPSYVTEFYGIAGEFDYANGRTDVVANHITLSANEVDDWLVKGLTYHTSGAGNEKEDIAEARLYLTNVGGTLLGKGTFTADNGNISFSFNVTVPKASSVSMVLVYDYKPERAWPCNDYRTKIDMGDVTAIPVTYPPGQKLPVPPNGAVHGAVSVKAGDIVKIDGDRQYGEAEDPQTNNPLEKPLKCRLQWQHPQSINFISYDIMAPQNGAFLSGAQGTVHVEKQPTADGYVEETMTLGNKKGQQNPYLVQMGMSQKGAACYSSWAPPVFTAWGLGLDLGTTSQYDNPANGDTFGTFLSNIQAENKFTLTIDMAPPDYAEVEEVLFTMGGQTVTGTVVTQNRVYEAIFDMAAFNAPQTLTITVRMIKDGQHIEQTAEYHVKSLALPSWVNSINAICHSESFTKEFSGDDGGAYTLTFNYPTNFAWSDYVPSSVGLLGGLNNDLDIEFTANAIYRIDETSTFGAAIKGQPVILGHEFGLEGGLSGDFDQNFAFQRGNGTLRASFAFDLPEKGYSKTFLIYGVPVTAAVDLSGNVEIFIRGSAVLNRQLEFEEITVAPGTTVTGNVTISLSAVFGLAKIAATGSPTATVEIELRYTTASGTTTTWRGEIVVPITVVGSIFWGLGSAELYSTELGPWTFPSGGAAPQAFRPLGEIEGPAVPRLLSTSALAIDGSGRRMTLWIDDRTPAAPAPDPDVFYRYYDGSAWSGSAPLIGTAQTNLEWETDPAVVFLNGGAALAAWTANKGDKSLNDLNDILAHQDIAFALWNGEAWTTPAKVIDDDEADGTVRLAYDGSNQKALAVWVHNADAGKNAMSRTAWKLMYALFDPAANEGAGAFAVPADVPGTATGAADQMPAIATDGAGTVLLLWARDDDGEFYRELSGVTNGTNVDYENDDSHIYWTRWNGTGWNDPQALATGGTATKLSPSVAFSPGGTALAVWTEKEVSQGATMHHLKYAVYADGGWSSPGVITESPRFIEDPKAVVDAAGTATVIWRAYAGRSKGGGALFSSTGQMPAPSWSEPKQITHDDTLQWQADAALDENNKVYTVWSAYDASSGIASTGTGFGSGVNVAQESPNSAALTGVYADAGVDADSNGIYESLAVSLGVNILVAGDYEVRGDLYKGDQFILSALTAEDGLDTGTHTFVLSFPGGILSDRGLDGPYALKQVVVMDRSDSPVQTAFAAAPHTTAAYLASQFVQGPLALDKSSYLGTGETALITVTDALANTSADSVQTIAVEVASTRDYEGFMLGLVETGPDTGVFRGTLGFSLLSSSSELERLLVADHDLIQVIYEDPNRDYRFIERSLWTIGGAGDVNGDGQVNLTDAIVTLQCAAHMTTETAVITKDADVDGDERIGMAEALYVVQAVAGLR